MSTDTLARTTLDELAEQIKSLHVQTCTEIAEAARQAWRGMSTAASVGEKLLEAKAICAHGEFQSFVELRLGLHKRTAQRYIQAYHARKAGELEQAKTSALQMGFDLLDFKPAVDAKPSTARTTGLFRFTTSFWDWADKTPAAKWSEDERAEFLGDLERREKLATEQGWR